MRVFAIDPSTKCGVAVIDSGKKVAYTEEIEFKKLTGFPRIQAIIGRVMELMEEFKPDLVVIEEMFVGHASSAITIIQIGSMLRYFLWQEDIKFIEIPPTVLKKFVVGSGNAKKEQMMMCVLKNWGHESKTNNTSDAVGLGMVGLCILGEKFNAAQTLLVQAIVNPAPKVSKRVAK